VIPPVDKGRGFQHRVGPSVEFGQCSNFVGSNRTLRSIVNDTGFRENFIVDSLTVTDQTADGDLPLSCKILYPRPVSLQKGRLVVVKKSSPARTVISSSLEKQLYLTGKTVHHTMLCYLGKL